MYEAKLDPVRDAGKFVYHLKTLRKAGLVTIEKGTKKYGVTELGKILVEFSRDLEEYVAAKRGRLFVRTSRMTIEEFDRTRIARSLVNESGMPQSLADEIAAEAEERLLKFGTTYLSAPLIRELVNTILIERKLEEYRHKLTRLGLPVNDVTMLLHEAGQKRLDATWVQESAGAAVSEEYTLLNGLPRPLVDAHLSGQIHLEEAASWVLKPSIFFHDPRPFLQKGTPGASPPSSLEAVLELFQKIIRTGERQVSGEQVFDHLNLLLAPFIRGVPVQRVQDSIRLFLSSSNWDGFSNTLPSRVAFGIDQQIPPYLERVEAIGLNGKREGIYADYSREAEELFRTVIDACLDIGRQIPLVNPSIIVKTSREKVDEASQLLKMAYESSAKYSTPNYLIQGTEQSSSVSSEGCIQETEKGDSTGGRAVIGTVQVNLPRASYDASGKDDRLLQSVQSATVEAVRALDLKQSTIKNRVDEKLLPLLSWQANGSSYFDPNTSSGEIGLIGLAESVKHHTHSELWEKTNIGFAKKIVEAARRAASETDTRNVKIRLGIHSSPEASTRLASVDAEKYGFSTIVYQGSKKYPYYTDVPTVPLTQKIALATRASVEGELQRVFDGGSLLPIMVGPKTDPSVLAKTSREMSEAGVRYFTYSSMFSRCQRCYHTSQGVRARCDSCGFEHLTILAKDAGRLVPVDTLPEARKRDMDRVVTYDLS
jgi:ribonucleoside-triphosphate reductase